MPISLAFVSTPELIVPVYNDVIYVITSDMDVADKESRFEITVTVNGVDRFFSVSPESGGGLTINISKILQQFITSELVPRSGLFGVNTDQMLSYVFFIKAMNSTSSGTQTTDLTRYFFNGATQDFEAFDFNDYLMNPTTPGKLLNGYVAPIKTRLTDNLSIQLFEVTFDSITYYYITDITVVVYYKNGDTLISNIFLLGFGGLAGVTTLDISPIRITNLTGFTIDSTVEKYTIEGTTGEFEVVTVQLVEQDVRFNNVVRLAYINHLGATNYIGFNLGFSEDLGIKKETYQNNNSEKVFDSEVRQSMSLISDYMTEEESIFMQDLWVSPLIEDQDGRNVILDVKKITIKRKRNDGLISYTIPFTYSKTYRSIKK